MIKKIISCILLVVLCGFHALAQLNGFPLIDSLLAELPRQENDTARFRLLWKLSYEYNTLDADEGIKYGGQAMELANKMGWEEAKNNAYNDMALNYEKTADYDKALDFYSRALKVDEMRHDAAAVAEVNRNIGILYRERGNNKEALKYDLEALNKYTKLKDSLGMAEVDSELGALYANDKNYVTALQYDLKALNLYECLNNKQGIANNYGNIGELYLRLAQNDKNKEERKKHLRASAQYTEHGISVAAKLRYVDMLIDFYKNLSEIESMRGNDKEALESYMNYTHLKDSMMAVQDAAHMAALSHAKAMELKDKEIQLKDQKLKISELSIKQKQKQRFILLGGIIILAGVAFFIARERKKSDKLLLNILPSKIADELKEKGRSDAVLFNNVTVIFSDFVNFTKASEKLKPQELVDQLHAYFREFDRIVAEHHIEKIKTVGDAYLAVAGLPDPDNNHAVNAVHAAIQIMSLSEKFKKEFGAKAFDMRIGVHTGSVVAGIVGVKKFSYDIWGDAVNVAARMEQTSEAGKINISEATYNLVKNHFTCTYRGELEAKNKGMMKMYFVE